VTLAPVVAAPKMWDASRAAIAVSIAGAGTGNGVVTTTPGSVRCVITNGTAQSGCVVSIEQETRLTLTADPQLASTFGGWTGACAGQQIECTIQPSQATGVTVQFTKPRPARQIIGALMAEEIVLTGDEYTQLDRFGNNDGGFDLGDVVALLDRTGETLQPATVAALHALVQQKARAASVRRNP
jgi:hypothetical protein